MRLDRTGGRILRSFRNGDVLGGSLAPAFINRGVAYFAKKNYDRAIADYDQGIRLKPDCATAPY